VYLPAEVGQLLDVAREGGGVDRRPVVGVAVDRAGNAHVAVDVALGREDRQRAPSWCRDPGNLFGTELPGSGPHDQRTRKERERRPTGEGGGKVVEVGGDAIRGLGLAPEVETLVDDPEPEVLMLRDIDELGEAPVERRGVLPADEEALNAGLLGPTHLLSHDGGVVARIGAELREVRLGPVPRGPIEPDVVVREDRRR
jgi:hypothetical protein